MFFNNFYFFFNHSDMTKKNKTKLQNDMRFAQVFFELYEIAMRGRYNFTGIPTGIDERMLRETLLWNGTCVIYNEHGNVIALPGGPGDNLTINGNFATAYVYAANGQINREVSLYIPGTKIETSDAAEGHGVLIRENTSTFPFIYTVFYYAEAISDALRTLDVIRKNTKVPALIACDPKILPSVKKFFEDRDDNQEYLALSTAFPADKISTLPFAENAANSIPAITGLIDWYKSQFRAKCGIMANEAIDKKGENLLSAEVNVAREYTTTVTQNAIDTLNTTLGQANEIFGLHIKATYPDAIVEGDPGVDSTTKEKEGERDDT